MDKERFETGGTLDFDRKGLEHGTVYIGDEMSVDIPISRDYEVDYHTHPNTKDKRLNKLNAFPSKEDIMTSAKTKSQASIVFHDGKAMVMKKDKKFRVDRKRLNKIERGLERDADKMNVNQLVKKYKPEYKKMGIDMEYIRNNKAMRLPVNIVEPQQKVTKRLFFDDEPYAFEKDLEEYKREKERRLNDPRAADKEEVEMLAFEQTAQKAEEAQERHKQSIREQIERAREAAKKYEEEYKDYEAEGPKLTRYRR